MTELSENARYLLGLMATNEYAYVMIPENLDKRTGKMTRSTPEHVSELITARAIRFPEGDDREDRLRCQITREGLRLYQQIRNSE